MDSQDVGQGPAADLHNLYLGSSVLPGDFRAYSIELLRDYYLPRNLKFEDPIEDQGSFSWAYTLTTLKGPSAALDVSLFALCLSQIYITGTGNTTLSKCLDWYNDGLQYLRRDLQNPSTQYTDETLAAIVVLSTCELFITQGDGGWRTHARGVANVIKARGTTASGQTPMWRHLLSRFRIICVWAPKKCRSDIN